MATTFTDVNFEETAIQATIPVVVDFGAAWCGPCNAIAPIVDKLAEEYQGKILIGKVDVDACPEVSKRYKVRNIPTILFMKAGEVVEKHVGSITESDLRKKLEALL